jgi:hypothetical protein
MKMRIFEAIFMGVSTQFGQLTIVKKRCFPHGHCCLVVRARTCATHGQHDMWEKALVRLTKAGLGRDLTTLHA